MDYPCKEITLDGEKYVSKKDLLALLKEEKKKTMAGIEPGYIQPKKGRSLSAFLALNHLGAIITKPERDEYVRENITHQKALIMSVNMDKQDTFLYFRGWCNHVPDRSGNVPIFSEDPNDAVEYEQPGTAQEVVDDINAEYPSMKLAVIPRGRVRIETGLRLLHALYGWPAGRDAEDVLEDELFWVKTLG